MIATNRQRPPCTRHPGRRVWRCLLGAVLLVPLAASPSALSPQAIQEIELLNSPGPLATYQASVPERFSSRAERGQAYRLLGNRWEQVPDFESARLAYDAAVAALEADPPSAELVFSLTDRAYAIYTIDHRREMFCPDRERAVQVARELGAAEPLVDALVQRAFCAEGEAALPRGLSDLEEATRVARGSGLEQEFAGLIDNATGNLYRSLGLHDHAYTAYLRAYSRWVEEGEQHAYFDMLHALVGEAIEVGRWQAAQSHVTEMLDIADLQAVDDFHFFAYYNEGSLALARGEYAAAEASFSRALALRESTAELPFVRSAYLRRAMTRAWRGDLEGLSEDLQAVPLDAVEPSEVGQLQALQRLQRALAEQDVGATVAVMLEFNRRERQKRYAFLDANTRRHTQEYEENVSRYEASLLRQQLELSELERRRAVDNAELARQQVINVALLALLLAVVAVWLQRSLIKHRNRSNTDYLTRIANRAHLYRQGEKLRDAAERQGRSLSVVLLDLDRFKVINDTLGHGAGDRALLETVAAVQAELSHGDVLGRLGGEEFAVILPNCDARRASGFAEKLRLAISRAGFLLEDGREVAFTASAGVATRSSGESFDQLVQRADEALYAAKYAGRNRVQVAASEAEAPPPEGVVPLRPLRAARRQSRG